MKDEAEGIGGLCDYILTHDRPIAMRADDSVVKIAAGAPLFVRRARGYVPYPQIVPEALRSPRCRARPGRGAEGHRVPLQERLHHHQPVPGRPRRIPESPVFRGDHPAPDRAFRRQALLHRLRPPSRVSTRPGSPNGPACPISGSSTTTPTSWRPCSSTACGPGSRVLGVSWDGYGYGQDGAAWGGEFLLAGYADFTRFAHFDPVPLPGGDLAAKQPWRMALAYLRAAGAAAGIEAGDAGSRGPGKNPGRPGDDGPRGTVPLVLELRPSVRRRRRFDRARPDRERVRSRVGHAARSGRGEGSENVLSVRPRERRSPARGSRSRRMIRAILADRARRHLAGTHRREISAHTLAG